MLFCFNCKQTYSFFLLHCVAFLQKFCKKTLPLIFSYFISYTLFSQLHDRESKRLLCLFVVIKFEQYLDNRSFSNFQKY